jgi:hypothetical protein
MEVCIMFKTSMGLGRALAALLNATSVLIVL